MKYLFSSLLLVTLNAGAALTDISPYGKVDLAEPTAMAPASADKADTTKAAAPAMQNEAKPTAPKAAAPATINAEAVYQRSCFSCHGTGAANAPKLGDKTAWAPRIATGAEALITTAINGKGAMPPKGGNVNLSDVEIKAVVEYMIEKSQ